MFVAVQAETRKTSVMRPARGASVPPARPDAVPDRALTFFESELADPSTPSAEAPTPSSGEEAPPPGTEEASPSSDEEAASPPSVAVPAPPITGKETSSPPATPESPPTSASGAAVTTRAAPALKAEVSSGVCSVNIQMAASVTASNTRAAAPAVRRTVRKHAPKQIKIPCPPIIPHRQKHFQPCHNQATHYPMARQAAASRKALINVASRPRFTQLK